MRPGSAWKPVSRYDLKTVKLKEEYDIAAKNRKTKVLTEKDLLKIEIAKEIGIWDQVQNEGWESLSNAVCGKVGGLMSKRLRNGSKS